ncbi:MAG: hypothetical protein C0622_14340 [Desulfuromonas sp.]|nr:MAG: hypothetical protein C0622_14340 [Desulfuromonas sp.]
MRALLMNMQKRFSSWCEVSRQRRELREHGAAICKDIGVSQATLDFEGKRRLGRKGRETPDSFQRNRKPSTV